ncbi:hypothetical protein RO3G_14074 [Rhizopus delemar RA 99-880]|uniref:Uncharacterized protein n=1 Tax=Rhizopus delemar (strain RA 99-880 / ATCC MYA-4621 / FGSC 9543 / NRRL 43880) TaxID=246409 RepID=I1CLN3_RHIO9|nr:hypothetical protein RO3G_14074 [Rhizopus delemar RA 99-880]|eukprot:EIE89363.1 hypothetical protein RO3G_14074 [Rhizopus delemar RA 99-880]
MINQELKHIPKILFAMLFCAVGSAPKLTSSFTRSSLPSKADLKIGYPLGRFGDPPRSSNIKINSSRSFKVAAGSSKNSREGIFLS